MPAVIPSITHRWTGLVFSLCAYPLILRADDPSRIAARLFETLQPIEVARSPTFTEGPVFDRYGNLFFSHDRGIFRLTPKGERTDWIRDETAGFNGHKILPDGTHLVCASKKHAIWRLDPSGKLLAIACSTSEGKPLGAPNDITLDTHGGFYFTDPGGSRQAPIGTVHYVDKHGKTTTCAGDLRVPNGLVIDAFGKTLYVAETVPNRVLRFSIVNPGELGKLEIFAKLPGREGHDATPDGLAMDRQGNLYVAHLGDSSVFVLDARGTLIQTLPGGNYDVTNLVFGGPHHSQLFTTGSIGYRKNTEGRVYRLQLEGVEGRP